MKCHAATTLNGAQVNYRILDAVVEVECGETFLGDAVHSLLRDVPVVQAEATAVLRISGSGDDLLIESPATWAGPTTREDVVPSIITILNLFALESIERELCLHAASPVVDGQVYGLVAASGVGKTTLLTALMRAGAKGCNDEILSITPGGLMTRSWPKPLSIKPGTDLIFPDLAEGYVGQERPFRHIPLSAVGSVHEEPAPLGALLLLSRGDRHPTVEPLDPTTALVDTIAQTMNFGKIGAKAALTILAQIAAERPCVKLELDYPDKSARAVLEKIGELQPVKREWELITELPDYASEGVLTARIEDRVAVWSAATEIAVALDPVATELWLDACHGRSDRLLDHPEFARSLVDHGLLSLDRTLEVARSKIDGPV